MSDRMIPLSKMRNPEISIKLATLESPVYKTIPPVDDEATETLEYYAAYVSAGCTPYGDEGEGKYVVEETWLGAVKDVPWTIQQVATALKNAGGLNTLLFNLLKALYKKAINVDVN